MKSCCLDKNQPPVLGVLEPFLTIDQVEAETVTAYDVLAQEYDWPTHTTTRILEKLSLDACFNVISKNSLISRTNRLLEIGCGTGTLSSLLLQCMSEEMEYSFLDSSSLMLNQAQARLHQFTVGRNVRFLRSSILSTWTEHDFPLSDLIVCGLGDPYFIDVAVTNIRRRCSLSAFLLLTLPEKSWAHSERVLRLHVPVNRTCFQLASGRSVYPFSFTYTESELSYLLLRNGFKMVDIYTNSVVPEMTKGHPSVIFPRIICALARAL